MPHLILTDLTHLWYILFDICHSFLLSEAGETIQRVINKSYKHIVIYTSKFVQNCPKRVDMLLRKHNRMLQNRLLCLYRHKTNKIVDHIRNRLFRIIFRNVYIPLPDICNGSEVSSVKESLRTHLPPKTISKKLSIGNISV